MVHSPGERTAFCAVEGQAVCLDIRRDRYFLLRDRANAALVALAEGRTLLAAEAHVLAGLEQRGVLRGVLDAGSGWSREEVSRSILDDMPASTSWHLYAQWMIVTWKARRKLGNGLEAALSDAQKCRMPSTTPANWSLIRSVATVHHRAAPVAWTHDRCLPRSLALYFQLAQLRQSVKIVIGVALQPFRAHCWVQKDGIVLNDSVDAVRAFMPIFVI
ncbi:lasso peptide biosynthesis B2 protein [Sphingomonas oryzagri]